MDIVVCFLLFFLYSVCGWLMEVICTIWNTKKFSNRGFLIGPYCPIYGYGCLFIIFLLTSSIHDPIGVFLKAVVICSLLEYMTSYVMEKLFQARWWDYSEKSFHINGRVCLETMIPFGILGVIVLYFIHPLFLGVIEAIPRIWQLILFWLFFLLYHIDVLFSFSIIYHMRTTIRSIHKDSTDEITKKVRSIFLEKSIFTKRLIRAFPKFRTSLNKVRVQLNEKLKDTRQKYREKKEEKGK